MSKIFIRTGIIILVILFSTKLVLAFAGMSSSFGNPFGGTVTNTKATEIQNLEDENYSCIVAGSTIEINPIVGSYPKSYYIPAGVSDKGDGSASSGDWILGLYGSQTPIICIYKGYPIQIQTVNLDTIMLFGTSGGAGAAGGLSV